MWRTKKLLSKFWRLREADRLRAVIEALPFVSLEESHVGAYVYAGHGSVAIGDRVVRATLRARMSGGEVAMTLTTPSLRVEFPMDAAKAAEALREAVRRSAS